MIYVYFDRYYTHVRQSSIYGLVFSVSVLLQEHVTCGSPELEGGSEKIVLDRAWAQEVYVVWVLVWVIPRLKKGSLKPKKRATHFTYEWIERLDERVYA